MSQADDEVARLLSEAAAPKLRLPRSVAELSIRLGRPMARDEMSLLRQASHLGPAFRIGFEDRLLDGADVLDLTEFLRAAADEVVEDLQHRYGDAGAEAGRLLTENRGR